MTKTSLVLMTVTCFVGWFVIQFVRDSGALITLTIVKPQQCRTIENIMGPEDIVIDTQLNMAFISSDDRVAGQQGNIYRLSLDAIDYHPEKLFAHVDFEFHPHGIDLYRWPNHQTYIYAINHRKESDFVEVFAYQNDKAIHQQSINLHMTNVNDLSVVDGTRFYFTQDHFSETDFFKDVENYLRLPSGAVYYYDGESIIRSFGGISFPNGIAYDKDRNRLYVASMLSTNILRFELALDGRELHVAGMIHLAGGLDNINIDQDGYLWVSSHPKLLKLAAHRRNVDSVSPSQVVKIKLLSDDEYDVQTVYLDDGNELSGSSSAAFHNGRLLIGAIYQSHFLVCIV